LAPGGQWSGALEGLKALVDDVGVAPMMSPAAAREGGAACQLGGFAGRPLRADIAAGGGVVVVAPWQDVRAAVRQGTGQAVRGAPVVTDQTAALCDQWCEGPHRRAWGREGLEFIARLAPELTRACRGRGIVRGVAGREGVAVLGQGQRMDGAPDEARL